MKRLFSIEQEINGSGRVSFAWDGSGNTLAVSGENRRLSICNRNGEIEIQFGLPSQGRVISLKWDQEGETLAILQEGQNNITLWSRSTKTVENLETGMKEITWIEWAPNKPILAIGTKKGHLLLYDHRNQRKSPINGKHNKAIISGVWSSSCLILLGQDRTISINKHDGSQLQHVQVEKPVRMPQVHYVPSDDIEIVSMVYGQSSILLYDLSKTNSEPVQLDFRESLDNIVALDWISDSEIIVGFSSGSAVLVQAREPKFGEELSIGQVHEVNFSDLIFSHALQKVAAIGDNCIRMFDATQRALREGRHEVTEVEQEIGVLEDIGWTSDGQILTVSTRKGDVHGFLTKIPALHAASGTKLAVMTSLREFSVRDVSNNTTIASVTASVEPSFLSIGPHHGAVGMNNRVWYYQIQSGSAPLTMEREYIGVVDRICIGTSHAAVLSQGKVYIHPLDSSDASKKNTQHVLPHSQNSYAKCIGIGGDMIVIGTKGGALIVFSLADGAVVSEYRFGVGIRSVYPNPAGTVVVCIDDNNSAFLYSPINDSIVQIDQFSGVNGHVMWDSYFTRHLVNTDMLQVVVHIMRPYSLNGRMSMDIVTHQDSQQKPFTTNLPSLFHPILSYRGKLFCQKPSGAVVVVALDTHRFAERTDVDADNRIPLFHQALSLDCLEQAFNLASLIDDNDTWHTLASACLSRLDVKKTICIYHRIGDAASAMALESLLSEDEISFLLANIHLFKKNFEKAQDWFLNSSRPERALEMWRDLQRWEEAMSLAERIRPDHISELAFLYAQQLESHQSYQQALSMYIKATEGEQETSSECAAGLARTYLRLGDIGKGMRAVEQTHQPQVYQECAQILEEMGSLSEASGLYRKAGIIDKAAELLIRAKRFHAASELMNQVESPDVHLLYAKAAETHGKYHEAERAFRKSGSMYHVVRLLLNRLDETAKAFTEARQMGTEGKSAALLVAQFCRQQRDYPNTVNFLLQGGHRQEAFDIAETYGVMDHYAKRIRNDWQSKEAENVGQYYQEKGDLGKAGLWYGRAGRYHKAVQMYLQGGEQYIGEAIDLVRRAGDDMLFKYLVDYLEGKADGLRKSPRHILELYMAVGDYAEAAQMALLHATEEQERGRYAETRNILRDSVLALRRHNMHVPRELWQSLLIVHSWIITRVLAAIGDKDGVARLHLRVVDNISRFPADTVSILTSTAIRCDRAGLKQSAFKHAATLIKNKNYRQSVDQKYVKFLENIVRKHRASNTDPSEKETPCPVCEEPVPEMQLHCPTCKNSLPFCVASGRHMVRDDWSQCPHCDMPALHSVLQQIVTTAGTKDDMNSECPMCKNNINAQDAALISNPSRYIKEYCS